MVATKVCGAELYALYIVERAVRSLSFTVADPEAGKSWVTFLFSVKTWAGRTFAAGFTFATDLSAVKTPWACHGVFTKSIDDLGLGPKTRDPEKDEHCEDHDPYCYAYPLRKSAARRGPFFFLFYILHPLPNRPAADP